MKKTLTALLCSLFLLAPCSVAQTFTFETGRNGTGIVFEPTDTPPESV